eukprot:5626324-Prymnesium_polylepis.1
MHLGPRPRNPASRLMFLLSPARLSSTLLRADASSRLLAQRARGAEVAQGHASATFWAVEIFAGGSAAVAAAVAAVSCDFCCET